MGDAVLVNRIASAKRAESAIQMHSKQILRTWDLRWVLALSVSATSDSRSNWNGLSWAKFSTWFYFFKLSVCWLVYSVSVLPYAPAVASFALRCSSGRTFIYSFDIVNLSESTLDDFNLQSAFGFYLTKGLISRWVCKAGFFRQNTLASFI